MSFTAVPARTARANRSQMAVPGSNLRFIEKARGIPSDVVMFDLEDAVPAGEKEQARRTVIAAINEIDWGRRTLSVRINGLDTPFMYRDVIDVVEQAGDRLDLLMIPKVGTAADVYAVDVLVSQIEMAKLRTKRLGFELLIESALGMENVAEIAAASWRNESLHFGSGDYAASTGARTLGIGADHPDYGVFADVGNGERCLHPGDMWHYPLSRLIVAARARGLRPIDGPYAEFRDTDGFRAAAKRAAVLGCAGKWVIHPSQVEAANALFTPSDAELARARRIIAALEAARAEGKAAVTLDGRMIDIASIRQAESLVRAWMSMTGSAITDAVPR